MNTAIMIDCETLSTETDACILSIGAVKFDPFGDEVNFPCMDQFYVRVDPDNDLNLSISDNTLDWWSQQSPEAQAEAFNPEGRVHIADAFDQLYKFCWGATTFWSNGAAFDIVVCETIFGKLQKLVPWSYWQVRDCRTIYDLGISPKLPKVTAHDALADAVAQAIGVQTVCNILRYSMTESGDRITPFSKSR